MEVICHMSRSNERKSQFEIYIYIVFRALGST
jgi:hypothetical protein